MFDGKTCSCIFSPTLISKKVNTCVYLTWMLQYQCCQITKVKKSLNEYIEEKV